MRSYWRGDRGRRAAVATALAGSPDRFGDRQAAAIAYVTCHDGFTLADLVSYERKHNEANLEDNRDGPQRDLSRNWGAEGPSAEPSIRARRSRVQRSLLASLALGRSVPMLSHGDELGRTQAGNNNAYCHDSELTWVDWSVRPGGRELLAFTRRLFQLRRELAIGGGGATEWLGPDGRPLGRAGWRSAATAALGGRLRTPEADLLLLLNGGDAEVLFQLPPGGRWRRLLSTAQPGAREAWLRRRSVRLLPSSLVLLRYEPAAVGAAGAAVAGGSSTTGDSSRHS